MNSLCLAYTRLNTLMRGGALSSLVIMALRMSTLVAKFALTIFIAHSMGLTQLGLYGLVVGATVIGTTVAGLGLMNLIVRDVVTIPLTQIPVAMRRYWLLPSLLYVASLPFAVGFGLWHDELAMALLTWVLVLLEHLNADAYGLLLARYRARSANVLFFMRSAGWIFLFIPLASVAPVLASIYVILVLWLAANVATLGVFFYLTRNWQWLESLRTPTEKGWYRSHLSRSWLFYLSDICGTGSLYMDRYLITFLLGLEKTGIYMLFWSVANAIYGLVSTGTLQINRPHLIAAFNKNDPVQFSAIYRRITLAAIGAAVGLSVLGGGLFPFLLPYLDRPTASSYVPLLWALLGAGIMRVAADVPSHGLYARRRDKAYTLTNMLSMPVTALFLPPCVFAFGLYGAALAGAIAMAVVFAVRYRLLNKVKCPTAAPADTNGGKKHD